jgi:GT2 family glycosyltransferase
VFSCTRGTKESTALYRSVVRHGIDRWEFAETNTLGLPARYNRFLDEHAGRDAIAVFAHDDLSIEDVFFRDKLCVGAERFAVQGLAGAVSLDLEQLAPQTMWTRAPREHLSGAVEHSLPNGMSFWSSYGPVPRRCVVLDGVLLAIDLARVGNVRFDERFAFHFYDLDFCLSAHQSSLALGTVNVHAHHHSAGDFTSSGFFEAQARFREKWRPSLGSVVALASGAASTACESWLTPLD